MPSSRPCAAFEPISPEFDVKALVEFTPNFEWVVRIHCDMIDHQGIEAFEKLVLIHVILGGKPLVVEGYDNRLDRWTFAVQWLRDNLGSKVENPRDLTKKATVPMTFAHYLNHMALLTDQWNAGNYKDLERQRVYLKDIDCPPLWHDKLQSVLPSSLYYLNETTGDFGGYGAVDEPDPVGSGFRRGRGIAKAGDLMSCLPKEMRAENMMCYIGHEGTYTPAHREMCASLGQNIMVEASTGVVEDGKPTKAGSSIWFMTESKERAVVAEYWLSKLGHDIDLENHFAQVNAWKSAPFKTYVVEQKPGDFILIPPLAPHQVWNRGTRTMKVAWNRTTVETLEMALNEALPNARMVCRDEQYKNKAIIYFALLKYSKLLRTAEKFNQKRPGSKHKLQNDIKVRQLEKDFRRLHGLFTSILLSESLFPHQPEKAEMIPFEGFITCSYCRCNIFNRFLTCPSCVIDLGNGDQDTYDICLECYAMGRSCACIAKLKWAEQFSWSDLLQKHDQWRQQILAHEGKMTEKSPMSLKTELQRLGNRRTLAQICQTELKRRPWRDIKKPPPPSEVADPEEEIELDVNVNVKKTKKKARRSEKFMRDHARCHIDKHWEPVWKQAVCSECSKSWCYGTLFRAYDMKPQDVMANPDWKCPSCLNICSCRLCRHKPGYKPYAPTTTYLGHNTKAIADPRSVESLVDFNCSNIAWIQKAGDDHGDDTRRLKRRRCEADAAQAQDPELGDNYADDRDHDHEVEDRILRLAQQEGLPIDPALTAIGTTNGTDLADEDEDAYEENPEGPSRDIDVSKCPMTPQFVVPEGGILRDTEHAYDVTEAITYDYPDPDGGVPVPAPTENGDQIPPGYGPALPDSPGDKIAMISRKRKRNKLDEGDRAFIYKKGSAVEKSKPSEKLKKRQSLIVKLMINKEKLAQMNRMAIIAQRALNGVSNVPPPVIGSDLQALNTDPSIEGQAASRKARGEHNIVDHDDEFTPGRYRDRRKTRPDGGILPPPDSDVMRRSTRMQAVTYEEPSEDEFTEQSLDRSKRPNSKLAAMEQAIDIDSQSDDDDDEDEDEDMHQPAPGEHATYPNADELRFGTISPSLATVQPTPAAKPSHSTNSNANTTAPLRQPVPTLQTKSQYQSGTHDGDRHATLSSAASGKEKSQSKAMAEAQANKKAKMAAMEWMEHDSESLDGWSDEEGEENQGQQQQGPEKAKAGVVRKEFSSSADGDGQEQPRAVSSSSPTSNSDSARHAGQVQGGEKVMRMKARQSLPASLSSKTSSAPLNGKEVARSVSATQPKKVSSMVKAKVLAAEWGNSDSDSDDENDEVGEARVNGDGSSGAWATVNSGGSAKAVSMAMATAKRVDVGVGNHVTTSLKPAGALRGRGRPRGRPRVYP